MARFDRNTWHYPSEISNVLIDNVDRNALKPNMLTDGQNLVALDHELAFGFLMDLPFLRNSTPWELRDADKTLYGKTLFTS